MWMNRHHFLTMFMLGRTQRECEASKDVVDNYRNMFKSRISARAVEKQTVFEKSDAKISLRSCDMEGHAKKCVERYCGLANKTTQQLHKVATPCIDDHNSKKKKWDLLENCGEILIHGTYWTTRYSMVSEQTGPCSYKMDESM